MTTIRTTKKHAGLVAGVVLTFGLLTGCGVLDSVPSVSADEDGGSITIQGGDGESAVLDMDATGEIPDWFPDDLSLPDDVTVVTSSEFESNDGNMKSLVLNTHQDFDSLIADIDAELAALGVTPEPRTVSDFAGTHTAMFGFELNGEGWLINILDDEDVEEGIGITYTNIVEE